MGAVFFSGGTIGGWKWGDMGQFDQRGSGNVMEDTAVPALH